MKRRLRGLLRPTGHHRAASDMQPLADAITADDAEPCEMRLCPAEQTARYHAIHADGTATCWTCWTNSPAGDQ